jgi:sugar phosphate isomerase/epimerase
MTRRSFLESAGRAAVLPLAAAALPAARSAGATTPATEMGIASTSYLSFLKPRDAYTFLEHCHALGAGGMQATINGDAERIRKRAEELGMYVEAMVPLPKGGDTAEFEQHLKNAKAAGAKTLRAGALSGRRYETFPSLEDWRKFVAGTNRALDLAVPLLERHRLVMGLENHKDWTIDEHVALLKKYSSEYLGACVDFGNNISLLDDPTEVVERLAPFAVTTHVKDMSVERCPEGFLMSEMPLGTGIFDMPRMISFIKRTRPEVRMSLEMITRDPLLVPCLTDKYWITFPDRNGRYLARALQFVEKSTQPGKPLPRVSQLSAAAQLAAEESNVVASLDWFRRQPRS